MNIQMHIGYLAKELNDKELASLRQELDNNELESYAIKEYISSDQMELELEDQKILAVAKKIKNTPFYNGNHTLVIGALLPRTTQYDQSIREELPEHGDGIICLVTNRTDLATRKKLAEVNDDETMYCSNVERAILKKHPEARVHCRLDRAQRYNLGVVIKIAGESRNFYYSQSTFVGLVDRALNEIKEA